MNLSDPDHFHGDISWFSSSFSPNHILQVGFSVISSSVGRKPEGKSVIKGNSS